MVEIEGVVEDVVFRNDQNNWTVLSIKEGREIVTCVGAMPRVASGERLRLSGEWTTHREYGRQLKVESCESIRPTTVRGIERYLGSGVIKGVGPATAKLIVHAFGKHALDILDDTPGRLTEIDGIGPKRAAMIAESYHEQREARQAMVFLQTYGIGPALSARIIRVFGNDTQQIIRDNPYRLAERIEGVGFRTADAIATSLGIEPESEHRIACGAKYALDEAVQNGGHVFLPRDVLIERASSLLLVARDLVERAVDQLVFAGELVQRTAGELIAIYPRRLFEAETEVAQRLTALARVQHEPIEDAEAKILSFEKKSGLTLGDEQRNAIGFAVQSGVTILTGGPGTGKTTCLNCMLALLSEVGDPLLAAPTGRAAKRMSEATGESAQTLHRLLEYNGETEVFTRDDNNPLDADVVIVDETSMVDIFLMRSFLRALKPGCRVVFVGDADQLPSVGAGNVLGDMIESGVLPVARLREIHRQASESDIIGNAHRINRGEMPIWNKRGTDFFFERAETGEQAAALARSLIKDRLPRYLGVDAIGAIQVMTPMKKGDAGVWALNRMLQDSLNPPSPAKREIVWGQLTLREGDKVMQVRNNYDLDWERDGEFGVGVFNGDIGLMRRIDPEEHALTVHFDDDRVAVYGENDVGDLDMAYCMSVHKSQGSEFDAVILPLVSGPPMLLTRNLLYTAVTRAKRLVVIVGREDCVRRMVDNNFIAARFTALAERLRDMP